MLKENEVYVIHEKANQTLEFSFNLPEIGDEKDEFYQLIIRSGLEKVLTNKIYLVLFNKES